jgi:hypothetical protein
MLSRLLSYLCVGLLLGALGPVVSAQAPVKAPETYGISCKCGNGFAEAMPRLIADLKSPDEKVRTNVISILERFAPQNPEAAKKAVPTLMEVAVNFRGHAEALRVLAKIDEEHTLKALRQLLAGGEGRCRCGVTFDEVVASVGEPIVPHLIFLLREPNVAANAQATLVRIGEPAVPYLVNTFDLRCKVVVDPAVIRTLTLIGPKAKAAAPALERQMAIQSALKIRVAQALYTVSGSHQAALDVIHDALRSNEKAQRLEALQCLNEMRPKAKELIPTVLPFLVGDDADYHHHAMPILVAIGADAVPALIEKLGENNFKQRDRVMITLRTIGPGASAAVPTFITILNGNDRALATLAAESLPFFGPGGKSALPHLLAALKVDDANHRLVCANSIAQLDSNQASQTVASLVELLQSKNTYRDRALALLGSFGTRAQAAAPALLDLLKTEELPMRVRIAGVLHRIEPTKIDAVLPTLIEAIQAQQAPRGMQTSALHLLAAIGPQAKDAVPALHELLKASLKNSRQVNPYSVGQCLKSIGAMADTMPILVTALNSDNADEREDAFDVVESAFGVNALASLEAALANGQLRESRQVNLLLNELRQRVRQSKP